jgi:glutamate dehydrogenase
MSLYLRHLPGAASAKHPPIEASIHQLVKEISLLYCIPQNKFQGHFATAKLSLQETIYAHCVWVFVSHFLNRLGNEYSALATILDAENSAHLELLSKLKRRLRTETFTADYILEIINQYPELVHSLYLSFANAHYVQTRGEQDDFLPTLSFLRLKIDRVLSDEELTETINKSVVNEHHQMVMSSFHIFNHCVLKTNFYTPTKVALSFRMNPEFLPPSEYPQPLYGMFLVISSEFRGFHLRFRDIARGGIRIVKSRSQEAYAINARSLFDENYNLANTQQRKNKDIPEGGSKGVVLLDYHHQDKGRVAFEKYIDSILDLLLPPTSPGIKDPIVDLYGKEEILFMGPDENTANLVDWATEHARARGAPWWKSFFTGKSPKLGGIPHDRYGMTTLSVREFVLGIYRKLNLDPSKVRKLQTGGPDGDLGSNEILLSNEKYTGIVDGSGVLVDPQGINHQELVRLANARAMINDFDISKLSPEGYRVLVDDNNIRLPTGELVYNGTTFRNTFHLRGGHNFDTFVPCGGRPESIDLTSVNKLIVDGKSVIPYIVEGANLFITQDAKLRLEKAGCILYKDASANKGGVTSSSLEVLASLSFDDEGFIQNMCIREDGTAPEFYNEYVKEVQSIIQNNARLEFEAIWREHQASGERRSILSDTLSIAITKLQEELQSTELWDNVEFRKSVLAEALPRQLLQKIGLDKIMERVRIVKKYTLYERS